MPLDWTMLGQIPVYRAISRSVKNPSLLSVTFEFCEDVARNRRREERAESKRHAMQV